MSDVDELARIREENRLLIEDRSRFPDKPDAIGRIIGAYHANREAKIVELENRCRESSSEIARLREYARADARCPCCGNAERCVDDCTFAADCPAEWQRMVAARAAIGVKSKQEGR
jgi:hypothetical protein